MSAPDAARFAARYEPVIAVEARARLRTATKAFCNCAVAPADAEPNAHTCPVCLAFPGTLPVLNAHAVTLGARAALALGCTVHLVSSFVRAHRIAPEWPKGYQLTQCERPLATRGHVQIGETPEGGPILVAVPYAHLEEDAGRGVHDHFADASGFDYNLAGAPLLAVASAPDMRATAEAHAYVCALRRLLRYAGASEANLDDGSLRVTATLSVRGRGDTAPGVVCTVANLRSFDHLTRGLDAEFARQCALREAGTELEPRALLWDPDRAELRPARAPSGGASRPLLTDPDLPPLVLTAEWIDARRAELPELPAVRRARLKEAHGFDAAALDLLTGDVDLADYYDSVARLHGDPRASAAWIVGEVVPLLRRERLDPAAFAVRVRPADLARVLDMRRDGSLTQEGAREVFAVMARTGEPAARVAEREAVRPASA